MSRFYINHDTKVFIDLSKIIGFHGDWTLEKGKRGFMLDTDVGCICLAEEECPGIWEALVAHKNPAKEEKKPHPRVIETRWMTEKEKTRVSDILDSFGPTINSHPNPFVPNPLKPGVVAAPEEKLSSVKESSGAEFMRPVLVGHGPETRSINIIAPEEWRYCSISSDSNSDSGEDPLN